jgi:protein arginine kinase
MAGEEDGLMKLDKKYSLYSLIIGIKPANLNLWAKRPLDKDEMDAVRAAYLRQNLPEIADK